MAGFEAIYKQTVTLFNRISDGNGEIIWIPTVLKGVHLVADKSATWNMNGGAESDNIRLHVRYQKGPRGSVIVAGKVWYEPKEFQRLENTDNAITFSFGNHENFDFFVEGEFAEFSGGISDEAYDRHGFYNYMNARYNNVFAITSVAKYDLIPHFEIMAR